MSEELDNEEARVLAWEAWLVQQDKMMEGGEWPPSAKELTRLRARKKRVRRSAPRTPALVLLNEVLRQFLQHRRLQQRETGADLLQEDGRRLQEDGRRMLADSRRTLARARRDLERSRRDTLADSRRTLAESKRQLEQSRRDTLAEFRRTQEYQEKTSEPAHSGSSGKQGQQHIIKPAQSGWMSGFWQRWF